MFSALVGAAFRELAWGLGAVAGEAECWRQRARVIPDVPLREDALNTLFYKRDNADGAALFAILPERRNLQLLSVLVGFETIADFLDSTNEHAAFAGTRNGLQLHRALTDPLNASTSLVDYYAYHPWHDDAGFLRRLVESTRASFTGLPSHAKVHERIVQAAERAAAQALHHDPDPVHRELTLRASAQIREVGVDGQASWFERAAFATAWLPVLALLALAANPNLDETECELIATGYFWISLTATMLDGYADALEDSQSGRHSFISDYPDREIAVERVSEIIRRATKDTHALTAGRQHAVILACMITMYLSKLPAMRAPTRSLLLAGGPLTVMLYPIIKGWRLAYRPLHPPELGSPHGHAAPQSIHNQG